MMEMYNLCSRVAINSPSKGNTDNLNYLTDACWSIRELIGPPLLRVISFCLCKE
jgi:hypothetical protein